MRESCWRHVATGTVIGNCYKRHRTSFAFFHEIEAAVSRNLNIHLVTDRYASHKTPLIRNWLAKGRADTVNLTPTSSPWLNQVERFFALLTHKTLPRGIYGASTFASGHHSLHLTP
jgi:hypothetical protein